MAANKRAASKGAKGSAKKAAKAAAPAKKAGAPKASKPKRPQKPGKSVPKKGPPAKGPPKKASAPKAAAPKAAAPKAAAPKAAAPKGAAPKAAAPKAAAPKAAAPTAKTAGPAKAGAAQAAKPGKTAAKATDPRLAIPPPPKKVDKGLTKPGALGTGPVRLIPASSPSSKGLAAPPVKALRSATGSTPPRGQGLTLVRRASERPTTAIPAPVLPIPVRPAAATMTIEDRAASIEKRLAAQTDDFRKRYIDSFDMSWIYHDSALEGVVYTLEELKTGLTPLEAGQVPDSSLQPAADEIRRHKEAIEYVRDFGTKKRLPVTIDVIKKIYLILHPSEGDLKTVKYRKDIPQHRLYFHEYAPPDKIGYKVRQVIDWLNEPETKKTRNSLRIAARAHYDLLRVFPFQTDSGKVARLFMNLLLMRAGYPPSLIHSTERQRYYDALKGSANIVLQMVQESVENALSSVEKLLDEHETKTRAFVN